MQAISMGERTEFTKSASQEYINDGENQHDDESFPILISMQAFIRAGRS